MSKKSARQPLVDLQIPFFQISPIRLGLLIFFTFGVYDLYWFYRNWERVRGVSGKKMYAWGRALFSVIWIWPLFKLMFGAAQARGYKKRVHPFVIALLYLVFMIGASVLIGLVPFFPVKTSVALFASAYVSLALAAYVLVIAQKAASYTREVPAKESKLHPFNQYFIAALGFAVFVWNTPVFVEPASRQLEVTLTAEQRAAGVRANELLKEHDQCVANLNARWPSVDESNQADVDAYNKDYDTCEVIRIEQNEAADAYNASIGQ